MTLTDIVEQNYVGDVVLFEEEHFYSRDKGTILSGQGVLKRGTVLGQVLLGAASSAAKAGGNTGTGTLVLDATTPILANAISGVYQLRCTEAATDGGIFALTDPKGVVIGEVIATTGGTTFADRLKFVLTTIHSHDFVVGDGFDITIAAGSLKYIKPVDGALDGSNPGAAILLQNVDATSGDVANAIILVRTAIVSEPALIFDASITDSTKRGNVEAGLTAKGIKLTSGA